MRRGGPTALSLAAALVGVGAACGAGAQEPEPRYVRIEGTRVSLPELEGYVKSRESPGLRRLDGAVSILVTEVHRPYAELSEEHTREGLGRYGTLLLSRADVEIAGRPGFIAYAGREEGGQKIALWIAAFGGAEESVLLRARAPAQIAKGISDSLHATLVGARWDPALEVDPLSGLPFKLPGDHALELAGRIGTVLKFTRDGKDTTDSLKDPLLLVQYQRERIPVEERDGFCEKALGDDKRFSETRLRGGSEIAVDGLKGCEALAYAKTEVSEELVVLYQAALFESNRYYSFRGRVGLTFQRRFVPAFAEIVGSFKRR